MATTTTYGCYYGLTGFIGGTWTGMVCWPEPVILGDDHTDTNPSDGSAGDGLETSGEKLMVSVGNYAAAETYTGWTVNGAPITVDSGGNYWLYTDDPTLTASLATPGVAESTPVWTYCFARGTSISTPAGDIPVESLAVGDLVVTAEGGHAPVKWIGRQTRHPLFAKINGQLPVLIKGGALGEGLPKRDLYVSPDHAMLVDGVLVHALALVNGVSIVQMQHWHEENVEYYHIELENHELIFAEGAPAETFVDNASRRNFDNFEEYVTLHGEASAIPELPLPRVKNKRQLSNRTKTRLMKMAIRRAVHAA